MSTNATLPVVGSGADESGEVWLGTEVPSIAEVGVGVGGVFVVTVVRGGIAGAVAGVDVDTIVGGSVSTVSTGDPDDADVGADESPPSLQAAIAAVSSATSTTLDRRIIRSIMSSWANLVPAVRDNGARLAIASFAIRRDCDSTSRDRISNEKT